MICATCVAIVATTYIIGKCGCYYAVFVVLFTFMIKTQFCDFVKFVEKFNIICFFVQAFAATFRYLVD